MAANYTLVAKSIKHPAHVFMPPGDDRSLCGLDWQRVITVGQFVTVPESIGLNGVRVCQNCLRSLAATHDVSRIRPEPDEGAVSRALDMNARAREINGRLYRVKGESDIYTVVVPSDTDISPHCTCRASKIHPEVLCKHLVTVLGDRGGE